MLRFLKNLDIGSIKGITVVVVGKNFIFRNFRKFQVRLETLGIVIHVHKGC